MKLPVYAAIALTVGAMASVVAARWVGSTKDDARATGPSVVVAARPIEAGKAIEAPQVKAARWPESEVPEGAFSNTKEIVGRIARASIATGEPVLPCKLAPKEATGGLSSIIPEGKRAITVRVNDVVAVAGFALPGSYVDVLVRGRDENRKPFARIVLSRVKVLAAAQETTAEPDKPKVVKAVTLELTPRESEKLDLARSIGKLSLVLRNELDAGNVRSSGVRLGDIISSTEASTAPAGFAQGWYSPEEIRGIGRKPAHTPAP
ncbi:Flp pilus assembly protein CpaB [Chlorobium sp. N1]|uniref:Flp pilus assembly protein CpaB n=1 Tax=Chlorobium sp. N1 TaxID=2491138 RepID=UPI00103DC0D0|nr:Flp pilus assembly protein CpaB [Chlorobium sp. N1]TCD47228.1 Flp pilus assembly protein CpaB [Chlorobium sp. N1]